MVTRSPYIPDKGDLIWLSFSPQSGHEQSGTRPALVLSPRAYNQKTHLALMCPVTSKVKGYPFEVTLPVSLSIQGVVLSDQVKNLDWVERKAVFKTKAPPEVVNEVKNKIAALLEMP